jgi:cytochrome c oxidase cbb3-type subunit 3
MTTASEHDEVTGRPTTGHEWDGIKELNTPLPSWWLYVFYATIAFSIVYWVLFPAWPGLSGYTPGVLGHSARDQLRTRMSEAAATRDPWNERLATLSTAQIAGDAELLTYSIAGGRSVFAANCAPCHGAGGQGAPGFPVLADDEWLWGGDIANIENTIRYGVRSPHPDTRQSEMPRFVLDGLLTQPQTVDVAAFTLSLGGSPHDAEAAARGAPLFADQCAACHGAGGEGNKELGAPNLTDGIWLFGGTAADILAQVSNPRHGVMPAWEGRLDDATVKMLSVYVHSLGGGQ